MAKVVSLINMKGGVGKSTLTVNLAWHFVAAPKWRKNVLVIDLDPQFNSSQYMVGTEAYERLYKKGKPTTWEIFEHQTVTPRGTITLEKESDAIHQVEKGYFGGSLGLVPSRLELANVLRNPAQKERRLKNFVSKITDNYDLILIDCAPTESVLTMAAYLASEWILVPVKPEYLSSIGLNLLVRSMTDFKRDNPESSLELAGVVFNSTSDYSPEEALAKRDVRKVSKENEWHVFKNEVPYSRSFPKGAREGQPIFRTSYARSSRISEFRGFADEFAERIGL